MSDRRWSNQPVLSIKRKVLLGTGLLPMEKGHESVVDAHRPTNGDNRLGKETVQLLD